MFGKRANKLRQLIGDLHRLWRLRGAGNPEAEGFFRPCRDRAEKIVPSGVRGDRSDHQREDQDNGYAEKDPTNDIEGFDACRKICILASLCFGRHVFPDDIPTEGITKISLADVEYAKNYGKVIKLLGTAIRSPDDKVSAEVSPALIDATGPLANVNDVFNAVLVDGNAVGEVVFYGKGAGKLPTASAVVADVIDCAVSKGTKIGYTWDEAAENNLVSSSEMLTRLYVRGFASDVEKAKASVREIFAGAEFISRENAPGDEIAFITPSDIKRKLLADIESIDGFDSQSVIRLF